MGNGVITFPQFCSILGLVFEYTEAALLRVFRVFDTDASGYIDRHEVRSMLGKLGLIEQDAPSTEIDELIATVDSDGDGKVSFDEFSQLFLSPSLRTPSRQRSDVR